MRRVVLFGLAGVLLTAVETSALQALGVDDLVVHATLGFLLYLAVNAGAVEGLTAAAVLGYVWDLFVGTPPGMGMFLSVAVFVGVRVFSQALDLSGLFIFVVAGLAEAVWGLGGLLLLALANRLGPLALAPTVTHLLLQTLVSALVAVPIFRFAGWLDRRLGSADTGEVWLK